MRGNFTGVAAMTKPRAESLPHSWRLADWPPNVAPNRPSAAKHMVRTHRTELIEVGALVRVGRDLIILGEGYSIFLARKLRRVEGYEIAPNRAVST
jgi:hypothetical protein